MDEFDPLFFHVSPVEAAKMDPQERLFLEIAYACIEDAGYTPVNLCESRRVGIFVGVMNGNYHLGSNYSSIANRVSYVLNFQGPSMAVDTACSSSLTAIHLAAESIKSGLSESAIAGGVNVVIGPEHYLKLASLNMVSPSDRCRSFGIQADGFVDGEGVGAVVLRPLEKAIADGDHIYGIIKGSMLNSGGKTNGFTVPNPKAQSKVILETLRCAKIDPRTISYLEAHGTGTPLGDPVEIAGLTTSFQEFTEAKHFCAIGSVKSNIGHCESAAGIAGLTKVLLQMQHRQLVPSLNSKDLNPNIDFRKTPFVVQQKLEPWKRPVVEIGGEQKEYLRIAGVSSFGAGGANAHIVIEEYENQLSVNCDQLSGNDPVLIVLSAKNDDCLQKMAENLYEYLAKNGKSHSAGLPPLALREPETVNLRDMAFTLQLGREAMEERLAVLVRSVAELEEKLRGFVEGQDDIEDVYRGQVKRNKDALAAFAAEDELQEAINKWIQRKKYSKLLDLWVKGVDFDWNKLHGDSKPRRISLPTYPFAKERYWISEPQISHQPSAISHQPSSWLHPLVHKNTSNFEEQRFSSTFTGDEFFFSDHVGKGQKILQGLTYLEVARAAVEQATSTGSGQATESLKEDQRGILLKNVVLARPIVVNKHAQHVHIGLFPEENGQIHYEIYTEAKNNEEESDKVPEQSESGTCPGGRRVIHSQGVATVSASDNLPTLDIPGLIASMNQEHSSSVQRYDAIRLRGIGYGASHQGLEAVYIGKNQVLAKLSLPLSLLETQDQFVLHSSLMDSALKASFGLEKIRNQKSGIRNLYLPFALQKVEIFAGCTSCMWAFIRYNDDFKVVDKGRKFDIDLGDEMGRMCVRLKDVSSRMWESEVISDAPKTSHGTLMFQPFWKKQAVPEKARAPDYAQHLVMLCEPNGFLKKSVDNRMKGVRWITLQSNQIDIEKRFQNYASRVLEEVQRILSDKPRGKVLVQIVYSIRKEQQLFCALSGILKTAQIENPKLCGQLIGVEPENGIDGVVEKLKENSREPIDKEIKYQTNQRWVHGWKEVEVSDRELNIPWKEQGIYLLTGGAGGLGLLFAKEIAERSKNVTLILIGRSPLTVNQETHIKKIEDIGARVEYRQVDVGVKEAVTNLIQSIQKDLGGLHGILHSAGVIRDNYILKKSQEELQEVLRPKVSGLRNLDQASKELDLDFFVFFSSIAGGIGNAGQADYATANAFLDGYVRYRNNLVMSKKRRGRTLSINWPGWKEGGMQVDEHIEEMMRDGLGLIAMETSTGLRAFYQSLDSGEDQVMVIGGQLRKIRARVLEPGSKVYLQPTNVPISQVEPDGLQEKVVKQLKILLGDIIELDITKIDEEEPLENYGIDSIMINQLNRKLGGIFEGLSKTLFYEFQTLRNLAMYLATEHLEDSLQWTGLGERGQPMIEDSLAMPRFDDNFPVLTPLKKGRELTQSLPVIASNSEQKPIAIIGISGRYPCAQTLAEFWENLKSGKDCITEIPEERWSLQGFYHPDRQEAVAQGKSYSKWGGFVTGFADFDPLFFNISPKEALNMDPHERLFLEACWEVMEDAGYTTKTLNEGKNNNVGVFAGVTQNSYQLYSIGQFANRDFLPSSFYWSSANRVSYTFNFSGPSMTVDTACSSSLTAIHEACTSIDSGECKIAIAGGVNLYLHPTCYLKVCESQMLSEDGRCCSFGVDGNGYVPGEGVGAFLLKQLVEASADGDFIYGVIRITSVNHGGKTNGYTVPNPHAQARVIRSALDKAGINAREVSYVEAHGTGTTLGDPIEIKGLTQAFEKDSKEKGYCAIGAVKSNIGHLEAAAGAAGLTKVLLQFKHRQLVPTLHAKRLNPNVSFEQTPFVVQQALGQWKRPIIESNGRDKEISRIAGISSFGAGGSNAHIILEEWSPPAENQTDPSNRPDQSYLIVLSAKDEDRLKAIANNLHAYLTVEREPGIVNLRDFAYTLQVGREAMEDRLAMVVRSLQELEEKLKGFVEGKDGIEDLYCGHVKRDKDATGVFATDEDMATVIDTWIAKNKYKKLLDLWVKGLNFDWNKLYDKSRPHRISLPTYPFARERYWVPDSTTQSTNLQSKIYNLKSAPLHPLVHENCSTLKAQSFKTVFTGEEFYLRDHKVKEEKILPGVAYLEMIRAAGQMAAEQEVTRIKNIIWARPISIDIDPQEVRICLYPETEGIAYEVCTIKESQDEDRTVYNQGKFITVPSIRNKANQRIDPSTIQKRCSKRWEKETIYDRFKMRGFHYGPSFQAIDHLHCNEREVLASLSLPEVARAGSKNFVLHPSLMDAAIQSIIGFSMDQAFSIRDQKQSLHLPFAVNEVEINGSLPNKVYAYIHCSPEVDSGRQITKYDVDIADEEGVVKVSLKGFSVRAYSHAGQPKDNNRVFCGSRRWQAQIIGVEEQENHNPTMVFLAGMENCITKEISETLNNVEVSELPSPGSNLAVSTRITFKRVFDYIKGQIVQKSKNPQPILVLAADDNARFSYMPLVGLFKTAHLENPQIRGKLIYYPKKWKHDAGRALEIVRVESQLNSFQEVEVRYQDGGIRDVREIEEVKLNGTSVSQNVYRPDHDQGHAGSSKIKSGGVYWITGGLGGLGKIFARYIGMSKEVRVVLCGRSILTEQSLKEVEKLGAEGIKVSYMPCDVSNRRDVEQTVGEINRKYGPLKGIIHSAGVNRDAFILKKTREEIEEVFAAKVDGLLNIDETTKRQPLDFMVLFSSGASVTGNIGQADYAGANGFLDGFAEYRQGLVEQGKRCGKTVSINWSLWKEGGMKVDKSILEQMVRSWGMKTLDTETGLKAFDQALQSNRSELLVVKGEWERLRRLLMDRGKELKNIRITPPQSTSIEIEALKRKTIGYLKNILSSTLQLPSHRIDEREPLQEYGIDSVMVMKMTNQLEKKLGSLSKTLFFEYHSVEELVGYFVENHRETLKKILGLEETKEKVSHLEKIKDMEPEVGITSLLPEKRQRFFKMPKEESSLTTRLIDIAIIGLGGRYPMAENVETFWENLKKGRDCITEVPIERWEHRRYFDPDKAKKGKTYSKWGGFISDVDKFDPLFFNISPREAEIMDPQERLFLEMAWTTLEDAGYTRERLDYSRKTRLPGSVGVYVGVMYEEYQLYAAEASLKGQTIALSANPSGIANRVSYVFNFHGPSMAVDTMCSSSLTAIHLACEAICKGSCGLALAGGVNVSIHPNKYILLAQGKFVSSNGRCESFGKGGDGYVPGEGVGCVLLKPLSRAIEDRDQIYGVIKGTALNHGGKTNGYTVPNPMAQKDAITQALKEARVRPREISYIEAHGTGTSLGDPIEIAGLTKAYEEYTKNGNDFEDFRVGAQNDQKKQHCAIGSVKSNIGHLESAAGIAGLTKVLLQMKYRQIAPSLHAQVQNPHIDFAATPFALNQKLRDWDRPTIEGKIAPRKAGISSFGAGGSNAHIIIEEWRPPAEDNRSYKSYMIVLSAKNQERLREVVKNLHSYLTVNREPGTLNLHEVAYTLQVGREPMEERLAMIVRSLQELEEKLKGYVEGQDDIEDLYRGQVKRHKESLAVFKADEDFEETLDKWTQRGKYGKILELWVKGLSFDWNKLYDDDKPHRISLPTYPFARVRYWISGSVNQAPNNKSTAEHRETGEPIDSQRSTSGVATINHKSPLFHPLDTEISSDFSDQRFTSTFTSDKPKNVSLQSLSKDRTLLHNSVEQNYRSKTLQSPNIPSAQDGDQDKSKPVTDVEVFYSRESLQEDLATSFAKILYMKRSDVDVDRKFVDLGLDSVLAVEWIGVINKRYGISITATKIYDHPSIRQLAGLMEKELKKNGDGLNQKRIESVPSLPLNQLVVHVHQGNMDVKQATKLFRKFHVPCGSRDSSNSNGES